MFIRFKDIWLPYLMVEMFGMLGISLSLGESLGGISLRLLLDLGVACQ